MGSAHHKPQVISTDNGLEFKGIVSEYLESKGIVQHCRSVGDINALGLERGPRVSLASAGYEMRQRIADYGDILDKTHMKLIDIIRLVPEHFKLVEREPGKQDWYYVVKA